MGTGEKDPLQDGTQIRGGDGGGGGVERRGGRPSSTPAGGNKCNLGIVCNLGISEGQWAGEERREEEGRNGGKGLGMRGV